MLFNAIHPEETRVAILEKNKLINFDIEMNSKTRNKGNIYYGTITKVEPSLEACFINYGNEKHGFLPFKEINQQDESRKIHNKLSVGQKILIQVTKDERGSKGASLTTYISLPGRYLVLMTHSPNSTGISRKIDGTDRNELKSLINSLEVPNNMSIIARTAALGKSIEELQWDLNYLKNLWDAITNAVKQNKFLIYQESSLVIRSIRDHFSHDIDEIIIDDKKTYIEACQFMESILPQYIDRIKLYKGDMLLFSKFMVEGQIDTIYSRIVELSSGGSISIDHTEALTAIDVNSSKSNKESDIEATAFNTNLEATAEIAKQLRLRDLSGLIVIDFIDMEVVNNQRAIESALKQQLDLDKARIHMTKISKFGLLELSRQRLQNSLSETAMMVCPKCNGVGNIRSIASLSIHILRLLQEGSMKSAKIGVIHLQVPIEVGIYLLNEKRDNITMIEKKLSIQIIVIPNPQFDIPNFKIKKLRSMDLGSKEVYSYKMIEKSDEDGLLENKVLSKGIIKKQIPAVRNVSPVKPEPQKYKQKFMDNVLSGIIRLLTKVKKSQNNKFIIKHGLEHTIKQNNVLKNNTYTRYNNKQARKSNKSQKIPNESQEMSNNHKNNTNMMWNKKNNLTTVKKANIALKKSHITEKDDVITLQEKSVIVKNNSPKKVIPFKLEDYGLIHVMTTKQSPSQYSDLNIERIDNGGSYVRNITFNKQQDNNQEYQLVETRK